MKSICGAVVWCCLALISAGRVAAQDGHANRVFTREHGQVLKSESDTTGLSALIAKAFAYRYSHPDSALYYADAAQQQSLHAGYHTGSVHTQILMGQCYMDRGNYRAAILHFRKAALYCRKIQGADGLRLLTSVYSNSAIPYISMGDYRTAAYYYYQSLHAILGDTIPDSTGLARSYLGLGALWNVLGEYDLALYYQKLAEPVARKKKDYGQLAMIRVNLGYTALKKTDTTAAARYFSQALDIIAQQETDSNRGDHFYEAQQSALLNLGTIRLQKKAPAQAIRLFEQALAAHKKERHRIIAWYGLGQAWYALGDHAQAERWLTRGFAQANRMGLAQNISQGYQMLADIYQATGRYKQAFEYQRRYARLNDSLYNHEKLSANYRLEMQLRTEQKDKEIARKELLIAHQENDLSRKNLWIGGISAGALLIIILTAGFYYAKRQQSRILRLSALMQGEENERVRIARELHDGIGGMLAAVRMNAGTLKKQSERLLGEDPAGQAQITRGFDRLMLMLQDTCGEVRETAHNLMPDILLRHGLTEALKLYCERASTGALHTELQINGNPDNLPPVLTVSVYRIVQELVQNIIRHAQASRAFVQINHIDNMLILVIEDNGTGFEADHAPAGIGLQNVHARVRLLHGDLTIQSAAGMGTIVHIKIYLRKIKDPVV